MGVPQPILVLFFNLIPALSVWLFGWSAFALILLYWTENLAVGVINLLKIVISGLAKGKSGIGLTAALAPFFVFHYGLFLAIHAVIIWALFSDGSADFGLLSLPTLIWTTIHSDPFSVLERGAACRLPGRKFPHLLAWHRRLARRGSLPADLCSLRTHRSGASHDSHRSGPGGLVRPTAHCCRLSRAVKTGLETGVTRSTEELGLPASISEFRKFVAAKRARPPG